MLIALDYDRTYTRDPALWDDFLAAAAARGYRVICLTMRYPYETISLPCQVIYTSRKAKKPFAEAAGLRVDIWIDDAPQFIFVDALSDSAPAEFSSPSGQPRRRLQSVTWLRRVIGLDPPGRQ